MHLSLVKPVHDMLMKLHTIPCSIRVGPALHWDTRKLQPSSYPSQVVIYYQVLYLKVQVLDRTLTLLDQGDILRNGLFHSVMRYYWLAKCLKIGFHCLIIDALDVGAVQSVKVNGRGFRFLQH
ncbi:hypothetical protein HG530_011878 [Fusarium avenaceum]|nr:hypothetical protein HG530_011878 [Fusarium avenaceum]